MFSHALMHIKPSFTFTLHYRSWGHVVKAILNYFLLSHWVPRSPPCMLSNSGSYMISNPLFSYHNNFRCSSLTLVGVRLRYFKMLLQHTRPDLVQRSFIISVYAAQCQSYSSLVLCSSLLERYMNYETVYNREKF